MLKAYGVKGTLENFEMLITLCTFHALDIVKEAPKMGLKIRELDTKPDNRCRICKMIAEAPQLLLEE